MTIIDFENLMRQVTMEILKIPKNKTTASRVRIAWPVSGAPDWKITEDVAFIRSFPVDGQYNRLKDVQYQNNDETSLNRTEKYTRIMAVNWICYGQSGYEDADVIRNSIGRNEALINNKIFLIYDRAAPMRTPELFNGQWWERNDLTLYFNEQITRENTVPVITGAAVVVKTEGGDIYNGNITP